MGFATIIAVLALFVALVALWLVSDTLKKVENQNEKFLRAHIATIRDDIRDVDNSVVKMSKEVRALAGSLDSTDKRINEHTTDIGSLRERIVKLAEELEALDHSIPPRYRARVVQAKEAEKPAPKSKPTVQ